MTTAHFPSKSIDKLTKYSPLNQGDGAEGGAGDGAPAGTGSGGEPGAHTGDPGAPGVRREGAADGRRVEVLSGGGPGVGVDEGAGALTNTTSLAGVETSGKQKPSNPVT